MSEWEPVIKVGEWEPVIGWTPPPSPSIINIESATERGHITWTCRTRPDVEDPDTGEILDMSMFVETTAEIRMKGVGAVSCTTLMTKVAISHGHPIVWERIHDMMLRDLEQRALEAVFAV